MDDDDVLPEPEILSTLSNLTTVSALQAFIAESDMRYVYFYGSDWRSYAQQCGFDLCDAFSGAAQMILTAKFAEAQLEMLTQDVRWQRWAIVHGLSSIVPPCIASFSGGRLVNVRQGEELREFARYTTGCS